MLNDPLSEARETLDVRKLQALALELPASVWDDAIAPLLALKARLDALPAPVRLTPPEFKAPNGTGWQFPNGWFYPDAPVADAAAPRQQPPAAREDGGET